MGPIEPVMGSLTHREEVFPCVCVCVVEMWLNEEGRVCEEAVND